MLTFIVSLVYNTDRKLWHPTAWAESPLSGQPAPDKSIRCAALAHHQDGLSTRGEAITQAQTDAKTIADDLRVCVRLAFDPGDDVEWSGKGAMPEAIFVVNGERTATRCL